MLFAVKGRFVPHTRACLPGVYAYPVNPAQKLHLTSKPVALIEDLLAVTGEIDSEFLYDEPKVAETTRQPQQDRQRSGCRVIIQTE